MEDLLIMHKFREYCSLTGTTAENSTSEQSLLGNFLRKDFVAQCLSNSVIYDLIQYIEIAFKLSENDKIEQSVPFSLIEDLVEVGSYSALEQLLPYLDEKSSVWMSVNWFMN